MNIIIVGSKKLTNDLAYSLATGGHKVRQIEEIEIDDKKLMNAGIKDADVLLAMALDDNVNIMVSLIAKKIYSVTTIVAVVNDSSKTFIYDKFGISAINLVQLEIQALKNMIPA